MKKIGASLLTFLSVCILFSMPELEASAASTFTRKAAKLILEYGPDHAKNSSVEVLKKLGTFNTLLEALRIIGAEGLFTTSQKYTIFAPTDEAFAKLSPAILDELMKNPEKLKMVIYKHIVPLYLPIRSLKPSQSLKTMTDEFVNVKRDGDKILVEEAQVVMPDGHTANGTIHGIDTVIMP